MFLICMSVEFQTRILIAELLLALNADGLLIRKSRWRASYMGRKSGYMTGMLNIEFIIISCKKKKQPTDATKLVIPDGMIFTNLANKNDRSFASNIGPEFIRRASGLLQNLT